MKKIFIDSQNINHSLVVEAAEAIRRGDVVALPTETVYGLAIRADKDGSIEKLSQIKGRAESKCFTIALGNSNKAVDSYFSTLPPFGYRLMERFWPGPLTIVYYSALKDMDKVGIRVPANLITQEILKEANIPIYLSSANISGEPELNSANDIAATFSEKIDLIVDSPVSSKTKPSTVVDLSFHPFEILREGAISEGEIVERFIRKRILFVCTGNTCRSPMAQYLFKKYLEEAKPYVRGRFEIISAGVGAEEGSQISSPVASILDTEEDINTNAFIAHKLSRYLILSSDLIFTMEDVHTNHILSVEPTAEGRVFGLKKFLPEALEQDIPDPIGQNKDVYYQVYDIIKQAVSELTEWI